MTGARASVVRASLMIGVVLIGYAIERKVLGINSLSLAALILLLFNPHNLFDIGFQFSFICVLSIFLFANPLSRLLHRFLRLSGKKENIVVRSLSVSLAVWFGIGGVILYYFQIVTPITIVANLFVVPLLSIVLTLGFGLLIVAGVWGHGAVLFASCIKIVLNVMMAVIFLFSKIPYAYIYFDNITIWHTMGYYALLICLVLAQRIFFVKKEGQSPVFL